MSAAYVCAHVCVCVWIHAKHRARADLGGKSLVMRAQRAHVNGGDRVCLAPAPSSPTIPLSVASGTKQQRMGV